MKNKNIQEECVIRCNTRALLQASASAEASVSAYLRTCQHTLLKVAVSFVCVCVCVCVFVYTYTRQYRLMLLLEQGQRPCGCFVCQYLFKHAPTQALKVAVGMKIF